MNGETNLHAIPTEVMMKMIDVLGGRELVMEKGRERYTTLHDSCLQKVPTEVIIEIIEIEGCELIMKKNLHGSTALH